VYVGSSPASLGRLAVEVELMERAMLAPCLVKLPNRLLGLDPESPKSKENGAHREYGRCSRPNMTTMEAPDCGGFDPPGAQDLLEPPL
jgi:hypothetical protein